MTTLHNPLLNGFYPDPSILKVVPDDYLVNSPFAYFPGILVMRSRDLKNWRQVDNVISQHSQINFTGDRLTRGLMRRPSNTTTAPTSSPIHTLPTNPSAWSMPPATAP